MSVNAFNLYKAKLLSSVRVNSLPKDKFLDWSKLKAFADNKSNVAEKFVLGRVENIVGKGENAGENEEAVESQDCVVKS